MPAKPKPTHGGKRPGAGRPKGEPTRVLSIRVPSRLHEQLRSAILAELQRLRAIGA